MHPLPELHVRRNRVQVAIAIEPAAIIEQINHVVPGRDRRALVVLGAGVVRERDAELRVHEHRETRAVEAGRRACAAPDVRNAQIPLGERGGLPADAPRRER